ncbi:MAG: peptidase M20 [Azospira oryzae]|nr:MAG: peptidase M20 [Azospira oryzae]
MRKLFFILTLLVGHAVSAQQLFDEKALIDNLKYLSSDALQGRKPESKGSEQARKYIKEQFTRLKVLPLGESYDLPFEFTSRSGTKVNGINLAGWIKGTSKSGKYIVISAHYDHVGVHEEKIYNGTDDNASGTCALIALAEYYQKNKPEHDLIIAAFDAEEMGLQGAKAFVKNPPVAIDKIVANINMDMVARADANELVGCGTFLYPQLKPFIEKVTAPEKVKIVFGHDDAEKDKGSDYWVFSSDHGPFHSAKIPFIYFGVADHKDYHQPTDDFENVNPETYKSCVRLIALASRELDKGLN